MKKKKNPLGKSLENLITDINNLPLYNRYIKENTKIDIPKQETKEQVFEDNRISDTPSQEQPNDIIHSFDLNKIGNILKTTREKSGLTIGEISKLMHVRRPIIDAIENAKWEYLPHEIYVRGYIKEYSNILQIHGEISPYFSEQLKRPALDLPNDKKDVLKKDKIGTFKKITRISKATFLYPSIVVFIIGAFIVYNIQKEGQDNTKLEKAIQLSSNVNHAEQQHLPNIIENKKLLITCSDRTWISVIMDEKEKKEFMLNPGEIMMLNAKERFDILVGNAGGVKFIMNGKEVAFSGMRGQVKKITL